VAVAGQGGGEPDHEQERCEPRAQLT
jgi:hypothetical protein